MSMSLISCKFRTSYTLCEDIFREVITDDGLCFTFNSLNPDKMFTEIVDDNIMSDNNLTNVLYQWTLEDGYSVRYKDNTTANVFLYPYHILNAGSKAGLKLTLAIRQNDMDYACRGPVQGFKVALHTPNELPQIANQFFRIPIGQDVRVSIKPNVLKTTKSLLDYSPTRSFTLFSALNRFY